MEDYLSDAKYVIVKFDEIVDGRYIIDLVPRSWVSVHEDVWMCQYPPPSGYKFLETWVKNEISPKDSWKIFKDVTIIHKAYDYDQGERRTRRAYKSLYQISSSDVENGTNPKLQVHFSKQAIKKILNKSTSLAIYNQDTSIENTSTQNTDNLLVKQHDENNPALFYNDVEESTRESDLESHGSRRKGLTTTVIKSHTSTQDKLKLMYDRMNSSDQNLAQYIDLLVTSKIKSAKLSLQYDFETKMNELKRAIISESSSGSSSSSHEMSKKKKISASLPIENLIEFIQFDDTLNDNLEKQNALKLHFKLTTLGSQDYEKDIKNIIPSIIKKAVQQEYSATGRITKGVGKMNFSATQVYRCLKEFIEEKYEGAGKELKITKVTSSYLSGCIDREGGRRNRIN